MPPRPRVDLVENHISQHVWDATTSSWFEEGTNLPKHAEFYCTICGKNLWDSTLIEHVNSGKHQGKLAGANAQRPTELPPRRENRVPPPTDLRHADFGVPPPPAPVRRRSRSPIRRTTTAKSSGVLNRPSRLADPGRTPSRAPSRNRSLDVIDLRSRSPSVLRAAPIRFVREQLVNSIIPDQQVVPYQSPIDHVQQALDRHLEPELQDEISQDQTWDGNFPMQQQLDRQETLPAPPPLPSPPVRQAAQIPEITFPPVPPATIPRTLTNQIPEDYVLPDGTHIRIMSRGAPRTFADFGQVQIPSHPMMAPAPMVQFVMQPIPHQQYQSFHPSGMAHPPQMQVFMAPPQHSPMWYNGPSNAPQLVQVGGMVIQHPPPPSQNFPAAGFTMVPGWR